VHSTGENHEGFLHFVVAAPQEGGEKQKLAITTVGMTPGGLIARQRRCMAAEGASGCPRTGDPDAALKAAALHFAPSLPGYELPRRRASVRLPCEGTISYDYGGRKKYKLDMWGSSAVYW